MEKQENEVVGLPKDITPPIRREVAKPMQSPFELDLALEPA